eukprot:TRINITY_DN8018_c0_g1_i1.p1 TRINITY_DN8018_c0_g1~~TRINITY_DN8018_c0_g1_i1.p1  ORF type:complete len:308 (+),score=54.76 TRINITY_DN8018_c0_g1_i1:92-1015(+)
MWCRFVRCFWLYFFFFFQAEDGIRDAQESRGLGDVYKRQVMTMYVQNLHHRFATLKHSDLTETVTVAQSLWPVGPETEGAVDDPNQSCSSDDSTPTRVGAPADISFFVMGQPEWQGDMKRDTGVQEDDGAKQHGFTDPHSHSPPHTAHRSPRLRRQPGRSPSAVVGDITREPREDREPAGNSTDHAINSTTVRDRGGMERGVGAVRKRQRGKSQRKRTGSRGGEPELSLQLGAVIDRKIGGDGGVDLLADCHHDTVVEKSETQAQSNRTNSEPEPASQGSAGEDNPELHDGPTIELAGRDGPQVVDV